MSHCLAKSPESSSSYLPLFADFVMPFARKGSAVERFCLGSLAFFAFLNPLVQCLQKWRLNKLPLSEKTQNKTSRHWKSKLSECTFFCSPFNLIVTVYNCRNSYGWPLADSRLFLQESAAGKPECCE